MLLSVIVYNHELTKGQWLGAAVVFAGISVEAIVKRKGIVYHYTSHWIYLKFIQMFMQNASSKRRKRQK